MLAGHQFIGRQLYPREGAVQSGEVGAHGIVLQEGLHPLLPLSEPLPPFGTELRGEFPALLFIAVGDDEAARIAGSLHHLAVETQLSVRIQGGDADEVALGLHCRVYHGVAVLAGEGDIGAGKFEADLAAGHSVQSDEEHLAAVHQCKCLHGTVMNPLKPVGPHGHGRILTAEHPPVHIEPVICENPLGPDVPPGVPVAEIIR